MAFIANLSRFGTLTVRTKTAYSRKKQSPRAGFIARMQDQVHHLKEDRPWTKSCWYRAQNDGTYKVWLKHGIYMLPLVGDSNEMHCPNKQVALEYMGAAIAAANDGEFDEMLDALSATASANIKKRKNKAA